MRLATTRIAAASAALAGLLAAAPASAQSVDTFITGVTDTFDALVDLMPAGVTNVKLGLGASYAPKYEGDNNREVNAVPLVSLRYRDILFVDNNQIRINIFGRNSFIDAGNLRAGPVVRLDFGRDENDSADLTGLGDVGTSLELGGFISYLYGPMRYRLRITHDVISGHGGGQIIFDTSLAVYRSQSLTTAATVMASYGFAGYQAAFYSVDAAQSAASGLAVYDAGNGFKDIGLTIASEYKVTNQISIIGSAGYKRLLKSAANNPLVETRGSPNQFSASLFAAYSF